jgi:hypothetical protein
VSLMNKSRGTGTITKPESSQQQSNNTASPDLELTTTDEQWTEITGVTDATESLGMINIKDNQPNYVDSSHWTAILDNVWIQYPQQLTLTFLMNRFTDCLLERQS